MTPAQDQPKSQCQQGPRAASHLGIDGNLEPVEDARQWLRLVKGSSVLFSRGMNHLPLRRAARERRASAHNHAASARPRPNRNP